jgi:hypothetical protein
MKRWHNKNAQGSEGPCGQKEGETEEKKDQDQKMEDEPQGQDSGESSGEEYLRNVGEAVAQMLDPFGMHKISRSCTFMTSDIHIVQLTCIINLVIIYGYNVFVE